LKRMARRLLANSAIGLDESRQYGYATDALLAESEAYEEGPSDLVGKVKGPTPDDDSNGASAAASRRSVFISYNADDAPFATALASALRSRNIRTWIDQKEIRVGDSLIGRIGQALHDNDFIVVVLSPSSVSSDWVKRELKEGLTREISEKRVVVLPVIAKNCRIPPFLTDKKYADFTRDSSVALDALVRSIQQHQPPVHA
jgi:hypothetical protein